MQIADTKIYHDGHYIKRPFTQRAKNVVGYFPGPCIVVQMDPTTYFTWNMLPL